jgi:exonuclease VII large subunit
MSDMVKVPRKLKDLPTEEIDRLIQVSKGELLRAGVQVRADHKILQLENRLRDMSDALADLRRRKLPTTATESLVRYLEWQLKKAVKRLSQRRTQSIQKRIKDLSNELNARRSRQDQKRHNDRDRQNGRQRPKYSTTATSIESHEPHFVQGGLCNGK